MPLVTQHSRQLLKRSIISGATPSVFTGSTNHTDGTWGINDIYAGEMFWNMDDKKLWLGWENSSGNTGVDLIYPQNSSTGSCQTDFYTNNINECNVGQGIFVSSTEYGYWNVGGITPGYNTKLELDANAPYFWLRTEDSITPFVGDIFSDATGLFQTHTDNTTYNNQFTLYNNASSGVEITSQDITTTNIAITRLSDTGIEVSYTDNSTFKNDIIITNSDINIKREDLTTNNDPIITFGGNDLKLEYSDTTTYTNQILVNNTTSGGINIISQDISNSIQSEINLNSAAPEINLRSVGAVDTSSILTEDDRINLDVNSNSFIEMTTPLITIENGDVVNYVNNILIQDDANGIRIRAIDIGVTTATIALGTTGGVSQISLGADIIDISGGLVAFADDAAAGVGGLITGNLYQTDGTGAAPLNVAGIVMIKQ